MEPTAYTHVVLASSLLSFKNSLKNVDLTYTLFGKIKQYSLYVAMFSLL